MTFINLDNLEKRVSEQLEKASLTECEKILQMSEWELRNVSNLSQDDVQKVVQLAAKCLIQTPGFLRVTDAEKFYNNRWRKFTVGCHKLDSLLGGGIATRGITELAGESGCGKTQLCLQLSLTVQLPRFKGGLAAGAVYICTEDKFPSSRLQQLMQMSSTVRENEDIKFGDSIFIEHIADIEGLKQCIGGRLQQLLKQSTIGLIVIDSIAAVFRAEYDHSEALTRAKELRSVAMQLHALANQYKLAVVCVNQVADVMNTTGSSEVQKVPALGLAWANLVTYRLQMLRSTGCERSLHVVFSPDVPSSSHPYIITSEGIKGTV